MSPVIVSVAVPIATFILLTAVGSDLRPEDFRRVARQRPLLVAGLALPPLVLPALALGLIAVLQPPAAVAAGLQLIAACPIGGISNTYSYLARASTALSVALTALSCVFAVVTVPAVDAFFGLASDRSLGARVPATALLARLTVTVVAPVALGMLARAFRPDLVDRYRAALQRLSFALLGAILTAIAASDWPGLVASLPDTVPLAALFIVCSFVVGSGVGLLLRVSIRDRITLAIEFATRNVAVAATIALTVLDRPEFATFGTVYFLTEIPLMALAIAGLRPAALHHIDRADAAGRPARMGYDERERRS